MVTESLIPIRYAETDKMGVVYHANYLIWFEIARTDFLKEIGIPYELLEKEGLMSPVIQAELNYGRPLHYGEVAVVTTRLVKLSSVRSTFAYEVWCEDQDRAAEKPCCTGHTSHCLVREGSFKPVSTKREAPKLYEAYQKALEPLDV